MNKIRKLFAELKQAKQTALMPFITAGDPDLQFTAKTILQLQASGCHLLELGFPYSDPIADGPVIQESYGRALENNLTVDEIFEMLSGIQQQLKIPVVAMVSYSIIYRMGVNTFMQRASESGFSGLIIPDLPLEEFNLISGAAAKFDLALNPLVTPMTPPKRAAEIARAATGFVYFVSVVGITGERSSFASTLEVKIRDLRRQHDVPICIGFGISQAEHVKELSPIADGLIVGSAFVRRIAGLYETSKSDHSNEKNRESTTEEIADFAASLIENL